MQAQWMTIAEAAAAMKVHSRTIERRIAAGKIDSRRNEDGQIEVSVSVAVAQPEPGVEQVTGINPLETVREMADRQVDLAAGSASALVRVAQEQAMRAENQLTLARQDAGQYRREAHMALALVGAMFVLLIVGVGWGMSTVTSARATARSAAEKAAEATSSAREAQDHFDLVRNRLDDAVVARAKAEGELIAYKTELAAGRVEPTRHPTTTQPANLLDRIGDLFVGDRSR